MSLPKRITTLITGESLKKHNVNTHLSEGTRTWYTEIITSVRNVRGHNKYMITNIITWGSLKKNTVHHTYLFEATRTTHVHVIRFLSKNLCILGEIQ